MRAAGKMVTVGALAGGLALCAAACVHSGFERTGRLRLDQGREGMAPIFAVVPDGFEEVAVVTVQADGLGSADRLERHLLRRASLLGCAGVVDMRVEAHAAAQAVCVQRRELAPEEGGRIVAVLDPSRELIERAQRAGDAGASLLAVLDQVRARPAHERAWPLEWYVATYPNSPFAADVDALLVRELSPGPAIPTASVRMAPSAP